jgi:hypothetical protein
MQKVQQIPKEPRIQAAATFGRGKSNYCRVARIFLVQHTKIVKIYQMSTKNTKWHYNSTNNLKITKCPKNTKIFHFMAFQNMTTIGIFGLKISGNPDQLKFFQQQILY